jgi:hypothetical protein
MVACSWLLVPGEFEKRAKGLIDSWFMVVGSWFLVGLGKGKGFNRFMVHGSPEFSF